MALITLMVDVGFALNMFVAGAHVPVQDVEVPSALGKGWAARYSPPSWPQLLTLVPPSSSGSHTRPCSRQMESSWDARSERVIPQMHTTEERHHQTRVNGHRSIDAELSPMS